MEETAERIVQLIRYRKIQDEMGRESRETVRRKFLLPRLMVEHMELIESFRPRLMLGKRSK